MNSGSLKEGCVFRINFYQSRFFRGVYRKFQLHYRSLFTFQLRVDLRCPLESWDNDPGGRSRN